MSRRAYSLLELVFTLGIFAILTGIGWSLLRGNLPRYRMMRVAKDLSGDVARLRGMATASNRETRLRLTDSPGDCADTEAWGGAWQLEIGDKSRNSTKWELLPLDAAEDGADDDQSEGRYDLSLGAPQAARDVCLKRWDELLGPGTDNADSVVFSPQGWVTNPALDFDSSGLIALTLVNQDAARDGATDTVRVIMTRAGLVRLETGGHTFTSNPVGTATASSGP